MQFLPIILLSLILLVIAAALSAATVLAMAHSLLRPPRMSDGKALAVLRRMNPMDLNLPWSEVGFEVEDRSTRRHLSIAGWWIPAESAGATRTVIIVHGYGDAKVGAIAWAPVFREMGFHVLAIDLRAHGQSAGSNTTAGYHERYDLEQVIRQLRDMHPHALGRLVLFGVSLGAAVVAATAAEGTDGIDAVILECPFADFRIAAVSHGNRMSLPLVRLQPLAVKLAQRIAKVDFAAVAPVATLPHVACPIMIIHDMDDPFVSSADIASMDQALSRRSRHAPQATVWKAPGAYHAMALATAPDEFQNRVRSFLTEAGILPPPPLASIASPADHSQDRSDEPAKSAAAIIPSTSAIAPKPAEIATSGLPASSTDPDKSNALASPTTPIVSPDALAPFSPGSSDPVADPPPAQADTPPAQL